MYHNVSQVREETTVDAAEGPQKQETKRPLSREIFAYLKIFVLAFIAAKLLNRFVLINAEIPSESMQNLLMVDDRLFGYRLSYLFDGPSRYDVVMFPYPVDGVTTYIKRVIGLPGETVEIREGKIYINGAKQPIEENYLPEEWVVGNDGYFFEVPDDCYLVLGDNRNISEDARYWAQNALDAGVAANDAEARAYTYVHKDAIIGQAILKYYPHFQLLL